MGKSGKSEGNAMKTPLGTIINVRQIFGSRYNDFWTWFQKNESQIYLIRTCQEPIAVELYRKLKSMNESLTFEVSIPTGDKKKDFVISADGDKKAFPDVVQLYESRPKLERWNVIAFRPRREVTTDLAVGGIALRVDKVRYLLFKETDPRKVGVMLFMEGYRESEKSSYARAGFILLDGLLGEYDMETLWS